MNLLQLKSWLDRLRNDYGLAVLTLGGMVGVLWLAPFTIYRAWQGNWIAAVSDAILTLILGGAAWHAWRTGKTFWPGWIMSIAIVCGILVIGYAANFAALFWAYPAVLMMFFLVPALAAALLGVAAVFGAVALSWQELGGTEGLPFFLITNVLTGVFGYLISSQAKKDISHWQILSLVDPLTGIGNRRLMEVEFAQAFTQKTAAGTLALLDIDHFKQINDRYGHEVGDQVLRDLAATVQTVLRKTDRLYRMGGEEFVIWLPTGQAEAVMAILERARQRVRETVQLEGTSVTFSVGVSSHCESEPWEACLGRADVALYRAKREGRRQIPSGQYQAVLIDEGHNFAPESQDQLPQHAADPANGQPRRDRPAGPPKVKMNAKPHACFKSGRRVRHTG